VVDTKISALTAASAAAGANELVINEAGTSKKLTVAQLQDLLGITKKRLTADHAISSTTGTEVTGLEVASLTAGTYDFKYCLLVQSATTTVGPMLGVNFTGTATVFMHFRFADASASLAAEVHSMDNVGSLGFGFISGMAHNAFSSAAPNMGTTVGVSTINTNILCFIEGKLIVTATGNLELWHSSETATSTTVKAESSVSVVRQP
jgi:hypothetical protein